MMDNTPMEKLVTAIDILTRSSSIYDYDAAGVGAGRLARRCRKCWLDAPAG